MVDDLDGNQLFFNYPTSLESGQELRTLAGHSGYVNGVSVTADGRRVVSLDPGVEFWRY